VYFNKLLRNTMVNFSSITTCEQPNTNTRIDTGNVTQIIPVDSVDNQQTPASLIWKYYPNPTTGILTVEINGKMSEFYVADLTGKVLQRYEVNNQESITVDISEFANGIYLIRYEYETDKWMTGKVILSH
ncbi:MAG: T9SS type A sorting domain-containing protein, partial [Bacteroidia bacterium]